MLVDTLQHERLRPALEYVELCELVRVARRLERAYGYPLDVEFAVDDERVWVLQVRPVAVWLGLLRAEEEKR
jgi:pyruvate,water dikinase